MLNKRIYFGFLTMILLTMSISTKCALLDQRYDVEKVLAMMNLYVLAGIVVVGMVIKYARKK